MKTNNVIYVEQPQIGTKTYTPSVYQWDKGQIIYIENALEYSEACFDNGLIEKPLTKIIENNQFEIPDILLTYSENIKCYVQIITSDSQTTTIEIEIPVIARAKNDEYIYPDDEQTFREQMEEIMLESKQISNQSLEIAENIQQRANNGEFNGEDGNSAYQIALKNGFVGTEEEWIQSLQGKDGYSPTATVSKADNISTFSVTDKNGTTEVEIKDGEQGPPGETYDDTGVRELIQQNADDITELKSDLTELDNKSVKTINNIQPDENGNVNVSAATSIITETIFDEESENAISNATLLDVFESGKLTKYDSEPGNTVRIYPEWENGTISGETGDNNTNMTTRIRTVGYIEVGYKLSVKTTLATIGFCPLYYDRKYNFLGSTNQYQTSDLEIDGSQYAYVRIMCNNGTISYGNEYIYIERIKETTSSGKVVKTKKVMYTPEEIDALIGNYWSGKRLIFTGDSIPHGQTMQGNVSKPYPQIVADKLGMALTNYSIGGSTFASTENYGGCFKSKDEFDNTEKDTTKIYDVITGQIYTTYAYNNSDWVSTAVSRSPLSERISLMTDDADLIIYAGGTNDFQYNWTEVGTMTDRTNHTFYGALHNTCLALLEKYKEKTIIFCTPIKRCQSPYTTIESKNNYNLTLKEYGNIIKEVCDYYSIPIIDLYSISGLNPHVASQLDLFDSFKTHPLQAGHDILGAIVASAILGIKQR